MESGYDCNTLYTWMELLKIKKVKKEMLMI